MDLQALQIAFPALQDFNVTSPKAPGYNCIAWAAGTDALWWWPDEESFWPPEVPRENDLAAFVAAFGLFGYTPCDDGAPEDGFEKIAIYESSLGVRHAARQLPTGRWTSKLGNHEDIEHASPNDLEGPEYGKVVQYIRRRIRRL